MIGDIVAAFAGGTIAVLAYYWLAGRSTTLASRPIGVPAKVARAFQQISRSAACLFGFHRDVVQWHPSGQHRRCKWCGRRPRSTT